MPPGLSMIVAPPEIVDLPGQGLRRAWADAEYGALREFHRGTQLRINWNVAETGGEQNCEIARRREQLTGAGEIVIALLVAWNADRLATLTVALHGVGQRRVLAV